MAQVGPSPLPSAPDLGHAVDNLVAPMLRPLALGRRVLLPVLFAGAVGLIWEFGTRAANISPLVIVPLSAVWRVITTSFGILFQQSIPTVVETLIGFALASLIGIVLGTLLLLSLSGRGISREADQPAGGGNYFAYDIVARHVIHGWRPIDRLEQV